MKMYQVVLLLCPIFVAIASTVGEIAKNISDNSEMDRNKSDHVKITPIMFAVPSIENKPEVRNVCISSDEEFPTIFTSEQLTNGAVTVCFLIGIYSFTLLAIVCDKYFLPCVERICDVLNLPQDVAGATFMAMATSAPEFFVNMIGTFITQSDIGIGTVVGSNMYNTLGVSAIGSLAASRPIQLEWWPVTRDCVIYILSVTLLVGVSWDGYIYWYEGLIMLVALIFYFVVLFNSNRILIFFKDVYETTRKLLNKQLITITEIEEGKTTRVEPQQSNVKEGKINEERDIDKKVSEDTPFKFPNGGWLSKVFFIYSWPIRLVLFFTIPNPKTYPRLFPLTFVLCVFWIGVNSYTASWMLNLIGVTFKIPDSILGLTLLAAGGDLPESISITIMSRRGEGSIGVSNALGANTVNILMSLGLPWFIKTILMGTNDNAFVEIASGSIQYTVLALTLVAAALFLTLFFNKFRLSRKIGIVLCVVYAIFLILAVVSESFFMNTEVCT